MKLGGLDLETIALETRSSEFDLALVMAELGDALAGSLQYNADLFDAPTIKRMVGHLQVLIESIIANPDRNISRLGLLTPAESEYLLVELNYTRVIYAADRLANHLVEDQEALEPDGLALKHGEDSLSYEELNRQANRLANFLQSRGVGLEMTVAVCIDRSVDMVVSLLGVLKAGGAYIPLNPSYPQARLASMLDVARPQIILGSHVFNTFSRPAARIVVSTRSEPAREPQLRNPWWPKRCLRISPMSSSLRGLPEHLRACRSATAHC